MWSGASMIPILSPEEVGAELNLNDKVVEWIKNEPVDDEGPLLVLDFKDAFVNLGNYDANKAAVSNALFADWPTLYAARDRMMNFMPLTFYSPNGGVTHCFSFPVNQQQTIHTTVITWFPEQTGKLTIIPYQFFEL
uniref:Uncharacterized protein n=1 Tax=Acrobeloides nanus TaxID=290746 RepID=A0A914EE70_9BILA